MRRRHRRSDPFLRALSRLPLFSASFGRELIAIARNSTVIALPAGHVFARPDEFVVLVSGSVAVLRDGHPDGFIAAGDWWGHADLLARTRSSATAVALTDVECLVMSRNEFLGVFDEAPALRRRIVRSLASAARGSEDGRSARVVGRSA